MRCKIYLSSATSMWRSLTALTTAPQSTCCSCIQLNSKSLFLTCLLRLAALLSSIHNSPTYLLLSDLIHFTVGRTVCLVSA